MGKNIFYYKRGPDAVVKGARLQNQRLWVRAPLCHFLQTHNLSLVQLM